MNHGKHYVDSAKLIDRTKTYEPQEALELCCKTAKAKFDETVELHVLTAAMLISRFAALLFCPTALAKTFALLLSARATLLRLLRLPVLRKLAMMI